MVEDATILVKSCSLCGVEKPHARRSDRPASARTYCVGCTARLAKKWRERNWQRRKLRDTWRGMIDRCHRPDRLRRWAFASGVPNPRDYADAGIRVCARWRDPETGFDSFVADLGAPSSPGVTLDRVRSDRGYAPWNCRWSDKATQDANRKNARWIEAYDPRSGEVCRLTIGAWARRLGIARSTLSMRLRRGWDHARAVGESVRRRERRELPSAPTQDQVPF